ISIDIDHGTGYFKPKAPLTLSLGSSEVRTNFFPIHIGQVIISAATPGFPKSLPTILQVTLPFLLLSLSSLGGSLGGLFAFLVRKEKWWRIVIGLITGIIFYWPFIFGFFPVVPHQVVLNEISAFVIPTLGG